MPVHMLAWSGAKTDSTANEVAPAVNDNVVTRNVAGTAFLAPFDGQVVYAVALNDTITRAQFTWPSIRDLGNPEISPLVATAEPSAMFRTCFWGTMGPRFKKNEEIGAQSSNGASAVDTIHIGALISDGLVAPPTGRRITVSGTATITLIASAWASGQIALDQQLPFGRYSVIGMRVTCNDGVLARLIFPNQQMYRPGVMVGETEAISDYLQRGRAGEFGELGRFEQTSPPMLEILGGTAGAETPRVYLDLVAL